MIIETLKELNDFQREVQKEIKNIISRHFTEYEIEVYHGGQFRIYFNRDNKSVSFLISYRASWNNSHIRKCQNTHGYTKQEVEAIREKLKEIIRLK